MENTREAESRLASAWLSAGVFVVAMQMAVRERIAAIPRQFGKDDGTAVVEWVLLLSVVVVTFLAVVQALTGSVSGFASRVVKNIDSLN